jgi:hypothetical protein
LRARLNLLWSVFAHFLRAIEVNDFIKEACMSRQVIVHVPAKLSLEQSSKVLANLMTKLGHTMCYSGFDIRFAEVVDPAPLQFKTDKELNIQEVTAGH